MRGFLHGVETSAPIYVGKVFTIRFEWCIEYKQNKRNKQFKNNSYTISLPIEHRLILHCSVHIYTYLKITSHPMVNTLPTKIEALVYIQK